MYDVHTTCSTVSSRTYPQYPVPYPPVHPDLPSQGVLQESGRTRAAPRTAASPTRLVVGLGSGQFWKWEVERKSEKSFISSVSRGMGMMAGGYSTTLISQRALRERCGRKERQIDDACLTW